MKRLAGFFVFALISFSAPFVFSQATPPPSVSVKASVNKAFITVGDTVEFKIEIRRAPRVDILTANPVVKLRDFEIKGKREIPPVKEGDWVLEGMVYRVTSYQLGEYVIDPVTIRYKDIDGKEKELKTNKLYITVETIDKTHAPKKDIRDIKSVVSLPSELLKGILFALAGILFVLLGILAWLFFTRRDVLVNFFSPPLTPPEEALRALMRLEDSGLLAKGQVREFYFRMSEILKRYFQKRFKFKALEETSSEIVDELNRLETNADSMKLVAQFFDAADLVKFAKCIPEPVEIIKTHKLAQEIVEKTKPETPGEL
ncbi:MAG: hypothetical protein HY586_02620 [Candidatus Omnitrophica bacterium]|nr:hypothetical protein [Candidatus Omnitrophota bacterium]